MKIQSIGNDRELRRVLPKRLAHDSRERLWLLGRCVAKIVDDRALGLGCCLPCADPGVNVRYCTTFERGRAYQFKVQGSGKFGEQSVTLPAGTLHISGGEIYVQS